MDTKAMGLSAERHAPAFFTRQESGYAPQPRAAGAWASHTLQGAAIIGLLGYELERLHGEPDRRAVRLDVEMFRPAPMGLAQVQASILRDGQRLKVVEAMLVIDGTPVARASCQFIRPSAPPPEAIWQPRPWVAPAADTLAPEDMGWGDTLVDVRTIEGRIGEDTPKKLWTRERFSVVEGLAVTPFARAALLADFASPLSHASGGAISYINTDATLRLHRPPQGSWLGFETIARESSDGIALGHCRLHDEMGPIGFVSTTAMAHSSRS